MSNTANTDRIEAAIKYWENCLGKGTKAQRIMTERTIAQLRARLA